MVGDQFFYSTLKFYRIAGYVAGLSESSLIERIRIAGLVFCSLNFAAFTRRSRVTLVHVKSEKSNSTTHAYPEGLDRHPRPIRWAPLYWLQQKTQVTAAEVTHAFVGSFSRGGK